MGIFNKIFKMVKDFYTEKPSKDEPQISSVDGTKTTDIPNSDFYKRGANILSSNGWTHSGNVWTHQSYNEFKIFEKSGVYEITPTNKKYKILKIVKTENILKRIKEYNIYLNSKKKVITKDSFLSDFD